MTARTSGTAARSSRRVVSSVKSKRRIEDRRKQLVAAAARVFMEKGFHKATIRAIGAEAGLTQGTIYNYIRSKDDILYLVCEEVTTEYQSAVRTAISRESGSANKFKAAVEAVVDAMYKHQEQILLVYQEGHALDRKSLRPILTRVEAFNSFVAEMLADTIGESAIAVRSKELAVNLITFVPAIVALRRWSLAGKVPPRTLRREVAAFILRGLGVDGPASAARSASKG